MDSPQKILFQKDVFESICSNLSIEDIVRFMDAYSIESFNCQIRFFDQIDQQFRTLPGINPISLLVYQIIQKFGLNNSLFALAAKEVNSQYSNLEQIIPLLIRIGANINRSQQGKTALHMAISDEQDNIASILIQNGANLFIQNWDGDSSFQKAVQNNRVSLIPLMLEQLTKNPIYQTNQVPELEEAILSAYFRKYKIIFIILVEYILAHNRDTNLLIQALLGASANGWNEQILLLLNKGVDVNGFDQNKITALHQAVLYNHAKTVALLLNRGANVNVQDNNKFTPLILAVEEGFVPIVILLINRKADINLVDVRGKTALDYAIKSKVIQKILKKHES